MLRHVKRTGSQIQLWIFLIQPHRIYITRDDIRLVSFNITLKTQYKETIDSQKSKIQKLLNLSGGI
ncbi:hypothetical protein C9411_05350 [Serratia sp. Nf2]|nr:hypothetical protein C9411_05350 [Serratia sp. Nf2]